MTPSTSPTIDQLLEHNRALLSKVAELEQRIAESQTDDYRVSWLAISNALDQAKPAWRGAGVTATGAAVNTILSGLPLKNLAAFLVTRGSDVRPLLSLVAVQAYEKKGYITIPMYTL